MIPDSIRSFYADIPGKIDPTAFSVGFFEIRWYAIAYLAGFAVVYLLLQYRIKKGEGSYNLALLEDFLFYGFLGVLAGGRLGYAFFYNFSYYSQNILEIFFPFKISCFLIHNSCFTYTGIYGMSYHGGLIGVILAAWLFCRKNKISFWQWADFVAPAVPAGFFFGRIGNFANGELYGRVTSGWWGMYFPADASGLLRHPSQLYEAFFEGLVLFAILWTLRRKEHFNNCHPELDSGTNVNKYSIKIRFRIKSGMTQNGALLTSYLFLYGLFRFFLEFFREPDAHLGFIWAGLTLGQFLSLGMIIFSIFLLIYTFKTRSEKV